MTETIDLKSADGRFDVMAAACPTRQVIGRVGGKWSLLVLYALSTGTKRFSQLRSEVDGISQKMLTQTLRLMERDGLVGPADGSKPREILKSPDWITEIESSMR